VTTLDEAAIESLDFDKGQGLVTVVTVDATDGAVLMVAHADADAVRATLRTNELHLTSRTRGPWHKGATSGNVQHVVALVADCDHDAVLAVVTPAGPACHEGTRSCFDDPAAAAGVLGRLDALVARRAAMDPPSGYVGELLTDQNKRLKKLGEEATELAVAAAAADRAAVAEETADLVFHALVAARAAGVTFTDVLGVLAGRERSE
jgi:phosphoribosyl-ATP pyrophosphohydrolase/phosphoribosyl-AMP cyclohydrolase